MSTAAGCALYACKSLPKNTLKISKKSKPTAEQNSGIYSAFKFYSVLCMIAPKLESGFGMIWVYCLDFDQFCMSKIC